MTQLDRIFSSLTAANIPQRSEFSESLQKSAGSQIEPYRPPKEKLRLLVGKSPKYPESIGSHPDFIHLGPDDMEYHYITSVFVDIRGSTALGTKLPLPEVRFIKQGILTTAIDTFQALDGHIHRLQGDAIFAMFGRRDMHKSDAIIDALNAASLLQYYFGHTLSAAFTERDLPPIQIRTGIDFGDDDKVLWSQFGVKDCNEITTISVHTDLAAKLQSHAAANCIMIGGNIVERLDLPDEFYSLKMVTRDGAQVEDRYVFRNEHLTYPMWVFDWEKYLNRFVSFTASNHSQYRWTAPHHFRFRCYCRYEGEEEYQTEYHPNSKALPKGVGLKFVLEIPEWLRYDEIEWVVINRGQEAKEAEQIQYPMTSYKNSKVCYQATAYLGHHYMQCTIKLNKQVVAQEQFGVYIRND